MALEHKQKVQMQQHMMLIIKQRETQRKLELAKIECEVLSKVKSQSITPKLSKVDLLVKLTVSSPSSSLEVSIGQHTSVCSFFHPMYSDFTGSANFYRKYDGSTWCKLTTRVG